jgi:RNA polymerase sigma-70 factor (ECF subfamily)
LVAGERINAGENIDGIIDRHSGLVYRLALARTGSAHDAEDVYQDVFLALISKPRVFNDDEHLKAWLIRVTVNRCRSLLSSAWRRKTQPLTDDIPYQTREQSDLLEYLSPLPPKYRAVIHLFYGEELSVEQIGRVLHAKPSTVRAWLTRARAMLKEKLKEDYFNG